MNAEGAKTYKFIPVLRTVLWRMRTQIYKYQYKRNVHLIPEISTKVIFHHLPEITTRVKIK